MNILSPARALRALTVILLMTVGAAIAQAQLRPWPDAVVFYHQGPDASPGFDSTNPYFPGNVLGPPDSTATGLAPASSPQEIQSLGTGGVIILRYIDRVIVDGPGVDFTVFENPFFVGGDSNNVYREAGIVSVSRDGVNFTEFPFQGAPLWHNLAGCTPTLGGNPLDPRVSGGDRFDLAEVGLDSVHYVKIVDAAGRVADNGPSFDLDAIAALHLAGVTTGLRDVAARVPGETTLEQNYPNPFNPSTTITFEISRQEFVRLDVFNVLGQRVKELVAAVLPPGRYSYLFAPGGLPSGVLYCRLIAGNLAHTRRMMLLQ